MSEVDNRRDMLMYCVVETALAVGWVYHTCPIGMTERVISLMGKHDEGANLDTYFSVWDVVPTGVQCSTVVNLATQTQRSIYGDNSFRESIVLRGGEKIGFYANTTGAHRTELNGVFERRKGEDFHV